MADQLHANIDLPTDKIAAFCRRWHVSELALFGSVLRADFNETSDIDVLATFAPGAVYTLKDATQMEAELEAVFGRPVDLVDKQAVQESPNYIRRKAILSSAEVVYVVPPEDTSSPDLVMVARAIPQAVICLVSALDFHDLTTQIPGAVYIALPRGSKRPRLDHPPLSVHWFSGDAWGEGIEAYDIDGTPVRVYGPAKSVADAFKFRRKIGLDVALEALKRYHERSDFNAGRLMHYARICRVESVMKPYVEILVA